MPPDRPPSIHAHPEAFRPIPGSLRIVRAQVIEPRRFLEALDQAALWDFVTGGAGEGATGEALKVRGDRAVFAAVIPVPNTPATHDARGQKPRSDESTIELPVIIKAFRVRGPGDVVSSILSRGRAQREWRGLWMLRGAGVAAAMPYLLLRGKAVDGSPIELLIMQRVPGRDLLRVWADGGLEGPPGRAILDRVGAQVAELMRATTPLFNRDHKPSNIVIDPAGIPTMIDAAGVRGWRFQRPAAMLAKLWIETIGTAALHPEIPLPSRTDRWRVLRAYCRQALGGWFLATPVSRRAQTKTAWRAVASMVAGHPDPTPSDDPLASQASARAAIHHSDA